jgi:hypothetical protein
MGCFSARFMRATTGSFKAHSTLGAIGPQRPTLHRGVTIAAMPWLEVKDYGPEGWAPGISGAERGRLYCEQLERGEILFFPAPPFLLSADDVEFLRRQRAADSRLHKNVSYRPGPDVLRGFSDGGEAQGRMHAFMRNYSRQVVDFVSRFLVPYAGKFQLDFASFRPLEEENRSLPLHKRNDLLHVDAFPSRPTRGGRILRVFTNVHPEKERAWMTGARFPQLASRYAADAGLNRIATSRSWTSALRALGLPARSAYDRFMLHFHDWLKENSAFQKSPEHQRLSFPPHATWLVFTDGVPHAALSGQFALEQTFIIPPDALVDPAAAPIRILEELCGRKLA